MKEIEKPLKSSNMVENVDIWDAEFIDVDDMVLFQIIMISNFLMIQPLLDLSYPQTLGGISLIVAVQKSHPILREKRLKKFAIASTLLVTLRKKRKRGYASWGCMN